MEQVADREDLQSRVIAIPADGMVEAGRDRLVLPATTLGDVYSLTLYPAMSSHRALPPEERRRIGIGDGLVRLSVGIEEPGDIITDLEQALTRIRTGGCPALAADYDVATRIA